MTDRMTSSNTPTPSNSLVSEAMIEAGYDALMKCKAMLTTDCEKEAVEAVYLAMQGAMDLCPYAEVIPANTTGSDELVERVARAICNSGDRFVYDTLPDDIQDWWRGYARAAINAIATPDTDQAQPLISGDTEAVIKGSDRVAVLERALAIAIASLGTVSVRCFDTPKSPLKPLGDIAREGLASVATTLGDDAYDRLAALSQPLGSQGGEK